MCDYSQTELEITYSDNTRQVVIMDFQKHWINEQERRTSHPNGVYENDMYNKEILYANKEWTNDNFKKEYEKWIDTSKILSTKKYTNGQVKVSY